MRKYFLAGNWKMNLTSKEAVEFAKSLVAELKNSPNKVMIAPNFTCLEAVYSVTKNSNILLGAQNMATVVSGAHTGETSVDMLKAIGVKVVILGHSERRAIYKEDDAMINTKVKLALEHNLEVILCVGETLEEREKGLAIDIVNSQLEKGLAGVSADQMKNVTIAYEPVWAIGTGKTATPEDAQEVHSKARKKIANLFNKNVADNVLIQYGGSCNDKNVKSLMAMEDIDGGLIGGASLKVDSFKAIANFNL